MLTWTDADADAAATRLLRGHLRWRRQRRAGDALERQFEATAWMTWHLL